jgi:hypothetical protein
MDEKEILQLQINLNATTGRIVQVTPVEDLKTMKMLYDTGMATSAVNSLFVSAKAVGPKTVESWSTAAKRIADITFDYCDDLKRTIPALHIAKVLPMVVFTQGKFWILTNLGPRFQLGYVRRLVTVYETEKGARASTLWNPSPQKTQKELKVWCEEQILPTFELVQELEKLYEGTEIPEDVKAIIDAAVNTSAYDGGNSGVLRRTIKSRRLELQPQDESVTPTLGTVTTKAAKKAKRAAKARSAKGGAGAGSEPAATGAEAVEEEGEEEREEEPAAEGGEVSATERASMLVCGDFRDWTDNSIFQSLKGKVRLCLHDPPFGVLSQSHDKASTELMEQTLKWSKELLLTNREGEGHSFLIVFTAIVDFGTWVALAQKICKAPTFYVCTRPIMIYREKRGTTKIGYPQNAMLVCYCYIALSD